MHAIEAKMNQIREAFYLVDSVSWGDERMSFKKVIVVCSKFREPDDPPMIVPLFPFGKVTATPGALARVSTAHCVRSLLRHVIGDWGDIEDDDVDANVRSLEDGCRIVSVYCNGDETLRIITEGDRSVTTLLLPGEY
jgi:hypothetical protein